MVDHIVTREYLRYCYCCSVVTFYYSIVFMETMSNFDLFHVSNSGLLFEMEPASNGTAANDVLDAIARNVREITMLMTNVSVHRHTISASKRVYRQAYQCNVAVHWSRST